MASSISFLIALLALAGWKFGLLGLSRIVPDGPPASPVAAIGLAAISCACLLVTGQRNEIRVTFACVLSSLALVGGAGIFAQYALGRELHLDQLLFPNFEIGRFPDLVSDPNTGLGLALAGATLLLFAGRKEIPSRVAHLLALINGAFALFALLGYAYAEPRLYKISDPIAMSFPMALALLLLSIAVLAWWRRIGILDGVVLLLTVVAANGTVSVLGTQNLIQSNAWVEHTREVSLEVDGVLNSLLNIESGARGYLYTDQPQYLDSYNQGRAEIDQHLNALILLTRDNPSQQRRLLQLRSESDSARKLFEGLVALQSSGRADAAKALVLTGAANPIMEQVRSTVAAMKANEIQLLGLRSQDVKRRSEYVLVMALVTHSSVALLLIVAGLLVRRDLTKRAAVARQLQKFSNREHAARQMAEAAHQRTESVLSSIAEMFTLLDKDWNIVYANEQVTRATGKPRIALLGKNYWSVFPETLGTEFEHAYRRAAETQKPETFEAYDASLKKWFNVQLYPAAGGLTVFAQDVTDLKLAQDGLVRAEKLAAVGRMASSIAHEINNPLEAITNLIWLARHDPSASPTLLKHLAAADEELRRVSQISKQALGFYRDSNTPAEVDLRDVIENVLSLYARRLAGKHISVRTHYEDGKIYGYPGELRQLFSNICANSLDALQPGGRLVVQVAKSRDWSDKTQTGVRVTFADDGSGIRRDHLAKLFQPFFTTKEATGTGLGLWVSKQIVEKHGGWIRLRSSADAEKHYTAVSVFIPARNWAQKTQAMPAFAEPQVQRAAS